MKQQTLQTEKVNSHQDASILVVDDTRSSRVVIHRILTLGGYKDVRVAENSTMALSMLQERKVDVLVADWMMPEIDGLELFQRVRAMDQQRNHYTCTVIITAKEGVESMVEAFQQGVDDYIVKSASKEEVLARVYAVARIAQLHNNLLDTTQQLREAYGELEERSQIDLLTDIGNQRYLLQHMNNFLLHGKSRGGVFAFAVINIEQLDKVRDRYNETIVNSILKQIAERLKAHMRPTDLAARISHDQFAIVLHMDDLVDVDNGCFKRFLNIIKFKEFQTTMGYISVDASISACAIDASKVNTTAELLLELAKSNITEAKVSGIFIAKDFQLNATPAA